MPSTRGSPRRRLGWRLEAVAYDAFAFLLRLLPVDAASALGGAILRAVGPWLPEHRVADRNLQLAFPEMDAAARRGILRLQWDNLGRTSVEFTLMDRIAADPSRIDLTGEAEVLDFAARRLPMILVSGHFANWETMMAAGIRIGLRITASYRAPNNPYIDERIKAARRAYGVELFAAKGRDGSRELIAALKRGEALVMLNDQRDDRGVEAPLFGRPAKSAQGPVRLALSYGGCLLPVGVRRLKGARFAVQVYPAIVLPSSGDEEADVRAGVARVNAFMEARIRENPSQYLWAHRRFPWAAYETAEGETTEKRAAA